MMGSSRAAAWPCQSGKRRAINLDAVCGHHLGLTVEREVVIKLGDDDVSQCGKCRLTTRDGFDGCGGLNDLLTGTAAIFRADMADNPPVHRHHVEHLVAIDAQLAQGATAIGAGTAALQRFVDNLFAGQMWGKRPHRRGAFNLRRNRLVLEGGAGLGFQFFERLLSEVEGSSWAMA